MSVLEANHVKKVYKTRLGGEGVTALKDVHFSVEPGEFVAIMGESGSGKTTLLNILASLDTPTAGKVLINGKDYSALKDGERAIFRRNNLGFIFQDFNLLDNFTIEDNIKLPLVLAGEDYETMDEKVLPLAKELGIESLLKKYPYEVSGGQKQRTAVARALITNPHILLADEPTGALDSKTGRLVMDLFHKLNEQEGKTIILITHSNELARETDRIISIRDGNIESEEILKPEKYKDTDIDINNKEEKPKKIRKSRKKNKEE